MLTNALLVKEDKEVEIGTQPFHTSLNCVEAQLYQDNVGPINVKESLEDFLADDWDDMPFGLFGPVEDEDVG